MTAPFKDVDPIQHYIMSAVHNRDTQLEMVVSGPQPSLNNRYLLHRKDLPSKTDIVFARRRKAILAHGCFWHKHEGFAKTTAPKARADFWTEKFDRNVERDLRVDDGLAKGKWSSFAVLECETCQPTELADQLRAFLDWSGATTADQVAQ